MPATTSPKAPNIRRLYFQAFLPAFAVAGIFTWVIPLSVTGILMNTLVVLGAGIIAAMGEVTRWQQRVNTALEERLARLETGPQRGPQM